MHFSPEFWGISKEFVHLHCHFTMGQTASKRKPSDVEERLIDPVENEDLEDGPKTKTTAAAASLKVTADEPNGKDHSSVSRILKLGKTIIHPSALQSFLCTTNCCYYYLLAARPERFTLAIATMALIVSSATALAQPFVFGRIVEVCAENDGDDNSTSNGDQMHDLNRYAILLIIILAIGGVATIIRGWLYTLVGERLVRTLRADLFHKMVNQDVSFFDQNKTGELMNRLSSDTTVIQNCLSVNISMGLRAMAEMIVSIALLFITSWELSCVMMAVVPALMVVVILYGRFTKRLTKEYQDALASAADTGAESIANSRIMKSFGAEDWESQQYKNHIAVSYQKGASKAFAYGIFAGGIGFLMSLAILVVIYYGATLVIHDKLSVGNLTSFILYTIYIAIDLGKRTCCELYMSAQM